MSNSLLWYRISYIVFKPSYILQILNMGTCINHLWQGEQGDPSHPLKSFVPVWNLRAVIWFPFFISSLFFFCLVLHFLSCHFSANGPSFFQKILNFFLWMTRLFCVALAEQLDGSWYVRLAAMWHWYFPLYICVCFTNLKQNKAQTSKMCIRGCTLLCIRGCTSGGVYIPCIYMHARWELL